MLNPEIRNYIVTIIDCGIDLISNNPQRTQFCNKRTGSLTAGYYIYKKKGKEKKESKEKGEKTLIITPYHDRSLYIFSPFEMFLPTHCLPHLLRAEVIIQSDHSPRLPATQMFSTG